MPVLPDDLVAALAGRYRLERPLGAGGMATVYVALDERYRRRVALKVLHPELGHAIGTERFRREIAIAARLQHPRILTVFDSGDDAGRLWYTMPFVDGESLRARLARTGALPLDEALALVRHVAEGLDYAHAQGVVHRDIKPENILLSRGQALVADFGIARALPDGGMDGTTLGATQLTDVGLAVGTPAYMSPEQALGERDLTARSDQYALACVAFELLTGRVPFPGSTALEQLSRRLVEPPPSARALQAAVPEAVDAALRRALARDPEGRFASVADFAAALGLALGADTPRGGAMPAATRPVERGRRPRRRGTLVLGAAVAAVAVLGVTRVVRAVRDERWVARTGLPELRRLAEGEAWDSAYTLARRIARVAPGDTALAALWPRIAVRTVLASEPPGARVWRAAGRDTSAWVDLGTTPTDSVWLPRSVGMFRFEKPGFRPVHRLGFPPLWSTPLDPVDASHPEMVRLPAGVDVNGDTTLAMGAYAIDRFEVRNREYKRFVDAGGYARREFWVHPVRDGDRVLAWAEAMRRFVDRTGRPGPATWEGGDIPEGDADLPVGGVSWYEADAYARFAGKMLPTMAHWEHAMGDAPRGIPQFLAPYSNFGGRGPAPVGRPRGVAFSGASDMGGNVREWVDTPSDRGDERFILGGGWHDAAYNTTLRLPRAALNRDPVNGIRLALLDARDPAVAAARAPWRARRFDRVGQRPVSDEVFASYRQLFEYDPLPLDAVVERRDSTDRWIREVVRFSAAYGGEAMGAVVFLPRHRPAPYQAVLYFPSVYSFQSPLDAPETPAFPEFAAWIVTSGRALVFPLYKATFRRRDALPRNSPDSSIQYRDHVVMWGKDARRAMDYLASRRDMDTSRVAFFGVSWGGSMGAIIPAIEPRLKAVLLYVAGFWLEPSRPEVDQLNYVPRVRQPVLMLNGRYDYLFPPDAAQEPFFRLLGTPPALKRKVVYEDGHNLPFTEVMKEGMRWLDERFGPPR